MRNTSFKAASGVSLVANIARPMLILALSTVALLLVAPRTAAAQNDAIRVMAGRVLGGVVNGDRNSGIYRDDNRRRDGAWERERAALERYCRNNRYDRRCDDLYRIRRDDNRSNANWCWDRDRNGRCDNVRNDNGRGRGSWRNGNDGWMPPGQRKKGR
jgi:hypothetical protein